MLTVAVAAQRMDEAPAAADAFDRRLRTAPVVAAVLGLLEAVPDRDADVATLIELEKP